MINEKGKVVRVLPDRAVALDMFMLWQRAVHGALQKTHDGLRAAVEMGGCSACPYRDDLKRTGGCRGQKCGINRAFDLLNRELRRLGRMKVADMDKEVRDVDDI